MMTKKLLILFIFISLLSWDAISQESAAPTFQERNKWKTTKYYIGEFSKISLDSMDSSSKELVFYIEKLVKEWFLVKHTDKDTINGKETYYFESDTVFTNNRLDPIQKQHYYTDSDCVFSRGGESYLSIPELFYKKNRDLLYIDDLQEKKRKEYCSFVSVNGIRLARANAIFWIGDYVVFYNSYTNFQINCTSPYQHSIVVYDLRIHKSRRKYKSWYRRDIRKRKRARKK